MYVDRAGPLRSGSSWPTFVEDEALPATGVDPEQFWQGLSALIHDLSPRNAELLEIASTLQAAIDRWHRERAGQPHDAAAYRAFLEDIGYLVPAGPPFEIDTAVRRPRDHHDRRPAAGRAGHQRPLRAQRRQRPLGIAVRRAVRHGRARRLAAAGPVRPSPWRTRDRLGARVPRRRRPAGVGRRSTASHADVVAYRVVDGRLTRHVRRRRARAACDRIRASFAGLYRRCRTNPTAILLEHHGLGIELVIDRAHPDRRRRTRQASPTSCSSRR